MHHARRQESLLWQLRSVTACPASMIQGVSYSVLSTVIMCLNEVLCRSCDTVAVEGLD